jgi:topoisomerase IA-like protein
MKKLISITLLSAVAILAAPKAPKAQNTTAPAATTTTKKVTKKNHVKKAKTAVKPVAATTPNK